jgi:hypothetical protein
VLFDTSYSAAEVAGSGRITEFSFTILAEQTKSAFDRTTTKDEVDN